MNVTDLDYSPNKSTARIDTYAKYVSDRDRTIIELVNYYIITTAISMFGVVANVMNIIVFYKQGFSNSMNISFCGLAVADLGGLLTLLWFNVILSGLLMKAGLNMSPPEVQYLTAGFPHICFVRITSWITVFITAERCLCITLPLKIKQIITPRRTTIIVLAIYVLIILSFESEYQIAYLDWRFDVNTNMTFLRLFFRSNSDSLKGVACFLYGVLGCVSFFSVIILTLILVIQLKKKSKWRKTANVAALASEAVLNRESKTMRMVVMIATVLIVCYTPSVIVSLVALFEHEFSVVGRYVNEVLAVWSFVFVLEAFNSSVNIFLYYYMSTKYRETFRVIFAITTSQINGERLVFNPLEAKEIRSANI